jgi:arylsulfatase
MDTRKSIDQLEPEKDAEFRPNVLWICTDQQRWDTIASLGNEHIRTPQIDRLVKSGTAFTKAFCQSPICTPSRSSFLTGMYASAVHGCCNGNDRWAEAAPLVTKLLADSGYSCGLAGKLHLAGCHSRVEPRPKDDGYSEFHWSHSHRDMWSEGHAYSDWVKENGGDLGAMYRENGNMSPELHQTKFCVDKAIEFIERKNEQPWLMSVNLFDPHLPFDPPAEYRDRYDSDSMPDPLFRESDLETQRALKEVDFQSAALRPEEFQAKDKIAAYYAMIEQVDDNVGRLLDFLETSGQRENTLVIFMSDHGEMLGDHGLISKGCRFYEGLVRVPLIFSWPGVVEAGKRVDALVELTDVAPTLLDYAGLSAPDRMTGRSLRAALEGGELVEEQEFVRCEYYSALSLLAPGREDWNGSYGTMIRTGRYKLVVYHGVNLGELYDLEEDPGEFNNLWDDSEYAGLRFELMRKSFDQSALNADLGTDVTCVF